MAALPFVAAQSAAIMVEGERDSARSQSPLMQINAYTVCLVRRSFGRSTPSFHRKERHSTQEVNHRYIIAFSRAVFAPAINCTKASATGVVCNQLHGSRLHATATVSIVAARPCNQLHE
jgi:hypothetical protein